MDWEHHTRGFIHPEVYRAEGYPRQKDIIKGIAISRTFHQDNKSGAKKEIGIRARIWEAYHLVKDVRERDGNRGRPAGNNSTNGKVINMVHVRGNSQKRKFHKHREEDWMNASITFPPIPSGDILEELLIIKVEVKGYLVRRVFVDQGVAVQDGARDDNGHNRDLRQLEEDQYEVEPEEVLIRSKGREVSQLHASKDAISKVLMVDRVGKQTPIWYVSRTLNGAERNYAPLEKLALCLLHLSRRLRRYFEAHLIKVITNQPIKKILNKPEASEKLVKYSMEMGVYKITYMPQNAIKGQVMADFINEMSVGTKHIKICNLSGEENEKEWTLYTNDASSLKGVGAGLVLIDPTGIEYTYTIRLNFPSTNNEAEYEALLAGLRMAEKIKAQALKEKVDSKLVACQLNGEFVASSEGMAKYLAKA
ncbi:reverse transcriptase domain-containing protein [Tanacetum coccineum]|uniref:Reverse transcriptase domain-containing protein n=1 Tax=Tanacetum coccineum TaxID=301880 RepID=A0ABQ4XW94_9ASTR